MTNSSELFNDGVLNLVEAKKRILKNVILQRANYFSGTLIGIVFHSIIRFDNKKHIFYLPEYKLKVSFLEREEQSLEVEVVEIPNEKWEIIHVGKPTFNGRSISTFNVLNGALHFCFLRYFQTLNEDLEIEIGNECDTAIKIDIVNKKFECINYSGETAPVDLLDAYTKMSDYGYFFTNVGDIHHEVSLERQKNAEFDEACEECFIYDMLDKKDVHDSLFLLDAYMVRPTETACLYNDDYGYTVLTGFVDACHFDSLSEPGEIMAAFKQLFGEGNTIEEILGATKDELQDLARNRARTRDKTSLRWVRFIQDKKGLSIH